MLTLIVIIAFAGILGGAVNFLSVYNRGDMSLIKLGKFLLTGIAISGVTPFILKALSSPLMNLQAENVTGNQPEAIMSNENLLVLFGLCLLIVLLFRKL